MGVRQLTAGMADLWNFGVNAFYKSRGIGIGPVRMLRLEVGADLLPGFVGRHTLTLERERPGTDVGDQSPFLRHQGTIAWSAMVRQDVFGVEAGDFVQHCQPTRRCATISENIRYDLVLYDIARDQCSVGLNKGQLVAFGVGAAKPKKSGSDAAEVDCRFLIESHVGRAQYNSCEQFFILSRKGAEPVHHFLSVLVHLHLLHRVADQDGARGKAGLTAGVLGMEVRGGQEEFFVVRRELFDHTGDRGAIFRAQSSVDDQRRVSTDDDGNVGKTHNRPDVVGNPGGVLADHRLTHLCGCTGGGEHHQGQKS